MSPPIFGIFLLKKKTRYDLVAELTFGVAPVGMAVMTLNIGTSVIQMGGLLAPADSFFVWINWVRDHLLYIFQLFLSFFFFSV
jgi:hypothetical protein